MGRGYRIAPITLDAWDWMFGAIYEDAKKRGDAALQQEMVSSYLAHSDAVFAYYEQLSASRSWATSPSRFCCCTEIGWRLIISANLQT